VCGRAGGRVHVSDLAWQPCCRAVMQQRLSLPIYSSSQYLADMLTLCKCITRHPLDTATEFARTRLIAPWRARAELEGKSMLQPARRTLRQRRRRRRQCWRAVAAAAQGLCTARRSAHSAVISRQNPLRLLHALLIGNLVLKTIKEPLCAGGDSGGCA
jgi:hypothetical protein